MNQYTDLAQELRDFGAERAGDGPSGANYDPELLDLVNRAAEVIEELAARNA